MSESFRPYADNQDSGLPWRGEIPRHWEVGRNGRLFAQRTETGFAELPILDVSLRTGVRVRDRHNRERTRRTQPGSGVRCGSGIVSSPKRSASRALSS